MAYRLIDPNENQNITFDWSDVLGSRTIASSSWSIAPTGPTLNNQANTDTTTTCYVSGVTAGQVYRLINRITTSASTTEERSMTLRGYEQ